MMRKKLNKKGMFFTILAISLLSLFMVSYSLHSVVKNREAINKRIKTLDNFVFSVEQDLPRQLYVSGYRIIFLFEKRIREKGIYIDDIDYRFNETFFNGSLYGDASLEIQQIMQGATFSGIQDSLNEKARKISANVTLSNPSLNISQDDPWNIKVSLTADLLIKDNTGLALWNKTASEITTYIPLDNFEDPIYIKGGLANKINQTIYNVPIPLVNLPDHVQNSYYISSSSAPSFLNRLKGNFSADANGIESLVYVPDILPGYQYQKSVVDYIYFNPADTSSSCQIQGMSGWFRLDSGHLSDYSALCSS